MSLSRLEALPAELLMRITESIPRPTDLKALCLTSRLIRDIATPQLYHTAVFHDKVPGWPVTRLGHGFLAASNPGLAHVRSLEVCPAKSSKPGGTDPEEPSDYSCEINFLRMALQVLPRNKLTSLVLPDIPVDEATATLICTQQRTLDSIELGPITFDFASRLSDSFGPDLWNGLRTLCVPEYLSGVGDLDFYMYLMRRHTTLADLYIQDIKEYDNERDNGPAATTAILTEVSKHKSALPSLRNLILNSGQLPSADRYLTKIIDFSKLESLAFWCCPGWNELLNCLTADPNISGFALKELHIIDSTIPFAGLEKFLRAFGGLKELSLSSENSEERLNLDALDTHKDTLEHFEYMLSNDKDADALGLSSEFFGTISNRLRSLRTLAVHLPKITMSHATHDEWAAYETALRLIFNLPKLELLRILDWPKAPSSSFCLVQDDLNDEECEKLDRVNKEAYLRMLHGFISSHVESVLNTARLDFRAPFIMYCAFGSEYDLGGGSDLEIGSVIYLPLRRMDCFGRPGWSFPEMTHAQLKYIDPRVGQLVPDC